MIGTNHEAAHYAVFSSLLSLPPPSAQTPSLANYSWNLSTYVYFPQFEKPSFTPIQNNKQNWFPYVSTFKLLHREQKYKWYYTKWQQTLLRFNLPWNSTSMQFSCVSVAPNVSTLTHFHKIHLLSFAVILFTTYEHALSFVLHSVLLTYTQCFQYLLPDPVDQPHY